MSSQDSQFEQAQMSDALSGEGLWKIEWEDNDDGPDSRITESVEIAALARKDSDARVEKLG